jgi:hypothetical protein
VDFQGVFIPYATQVMLLHLTPSLGPPAPVVLKARNEANAVGSPGEVWRRSVLLALPELPFELHHVQAILDNSKAALADELDDLDSHQFCADARDDLAISGCEAIALKNHIKPGCGSVVDPDGLRDWIALAVHEPRLMAAGSLQYPGTMVVTEGTEVEVVLLSKRAQCTVQLRTEIVRQHDAAFVLSTEG